jgi:protein transport protein SEC13
MYAQDMQSIETELALDYKIHDLKYNLYGTLLAVAGNNGSISLFAVKNPDSPLESRTFTLMTTQKEAHLGPIWRIEFCHPVFGEFLATCSLDKTLKIWQLTNETLSEIYTYEKFTGSVNGIQWAPHQLGFKLAACSSDGHIAIIGEDTWDSEYSFKVSEQPLNCVTWSPLKLTHQENVNFSIKKSKQCENPLKDIFLATGGHDHSIRIFRLGQGMNDSDLVYSIDDVHSDMVRD